MATVAIFISDGEGYVTTEFIADSVLPVHIDVNGHRYLVTGWDVARSAFHVKDEGVGATTTIAEVIEAFVHEPHVQTMKQVFLPQCRPGSWKATHLKELFTRLQSWNLTHSHGRMMGPE